MKKPAAAEVQTSIVDFAERRAEKKAAAKADAKLEGSKFVYGDDDVIRVVTEAELKAMLLPE